MGHPGMGGMPQGMGGQMPPGMPRGPMQPNHAPTSKKKRKTKEANGGGQMNHPMYGGPRGPMMGPGDMYRPPFEGGHPGMMPPGMMGGPRGPMGGPGMMTPEGMGGPQPGQVFMTPNGPMRMTPNGPMPIGQHGEMLGGPGQGMGPRMIMGPNGPVPMGVLTL